MADGSSKPDKCTIVALFVMGLLFVGSLVVAHRAGAFSQQPYTPPASEALERVNVVGNIGELRWPMVQGATSGRIWYWDAAAVKWVEMPHPTVNDAR